MRTANNLEKTDHSEIERTYIIRKQQTMFYSKGVYANNKGEDQPEHPRSMFNASVIPHGKI